MKTMGIEIQIHNNVMLSSLIDENIYHRSIDQLHDAIFVQGDYSDILTY